MVICAVLHCHNRSDRDKSFSFYRLPTIISHQGTQTLDLSTERQREWLVKIRRKDITPERHANVRVCSKHFVSGSPATLYDRSNPDWVPTLHMGYSVGECSSTRSVERYSRSAERARKRSLPQVGDDPSSDAEDAVPGVGIQTEISCYSVNLSDALEERKQIPRLNDEIKQLKEENAVLSQGNKHLKEEFGTLLLTEESFGKEDEKVLYYTGLSSWELFSKLYAYVKPYLKQYSSLSPFQQLLMALMRLRLNLSGQDLAYRFRVHQSTVSRNFEFVVQLLYSKLKPLIIWPDRDLLRKTMPMVFRKHHPNCVVIIDCFEIFMNRPTNLLARAQTYSQYKHHNTVKYLIGITPQGSVSYISDGWGGRTSDKFLTEHCSLLSYLVPGDLILADRGFDISDSVSSHFSTLKIPAFTKGKSQLPAIEVEQTRKIANVRIHVERVIGNIRKKYSLLSETQPIDFVTSSDGSKTLLDKMVYVCCALNNMCDSVISFE